jgi:hypothetical protein
MDCALLILRRVQGGQDSSGQGIKNLINKSFFISPEPLPAGRQALITKRDVVLSGLYVLESFFLIVTYEI